jgi:hypothetical protein
MVCANLLPVRLRLLRALLGRSPSALLHGEEGAEVRRYGVEAARRHDHRPALLRSPLVPLHHVAHPSDLERDIDVVYTHPAARVNDAGAVEHERAGVRADYPRL